MATTKIENSASQLAAAYNVKNIWGDLIVNVKAAPYSAVGDGAADDTSAIQTAMTAAANKPLVFEAGKTYKVTSKLTLPAGCIVYGNGATINMNLSGNVEGIVVNNNCRIFDLVVNCIEVTAATGGGQHQCPIVIGDYDSGTGYSDIEIDNVTITAQRTAGNGMLITGDSHNVRLNNLNFPASAKLGCPILIHWGGAVVYLTSGSKHPYNIQVSNINIEAQTLNNIDQAALSISGAYNIKIENVDIAETYRHAVSIAAGDYGFEYATVSVKSVALKGIELINITCRKAKVFGFLVDTKAYLASGTPVYESEIVFRNCTAIGGGDATAQNGIDVTNCRGVSFENSNIGGFTNGFKCGENVRNVKLRGGRFHDNREIGANIGNTTSAPEDITIENVHFYKNGTSLAGGVFQTGVYVYNGIRTVIQNCRIGDRTSDSFQNYGINIESLAVDTTIKDCHVLNVLAGGVGYKLSSSTDYGIIKSFLNNTCVAGISFKTGLLHVPLYEVVDENGNTLKVMIGQSAPTSGTWTRGDRVTNNFPSTQGTAGSQYIIQGWVYDSVAWLEQRTLTGT